MVSTGEMMSGLESCRLGLEVAKARREVEGLVCMRNVGRVIGDADPAKLVDRSEARRSVYCRGSSSSFNTGL